ncbi:hypothetical protein PTT_17790 [Pyrenophora teres f. teres 0-1]|uniref:CCHC-type domain-containing protein n=1 Tax=Pyrenophora teres f. teres (strain 0-1) TaxID=861557 RepID=E3S592_PYRTT|nr:hypothetical protein PTT_17790 [Pyrenophora teres f. teres 0-1]
MDWEPSRSQAQRAKWVSQQEIDRRRDDGSCLRCGKKGHLISACKLKPAHNPNRQPARATKAIGKTKPSAEPYDVEDDATTISPDKETEKDWVDEVAKFNFDINGYIETGFAYITPNDAEEDIILGRLWIDRNKESESAVKKARLTRSKSEKSALLNFNG